MENRQPTYPGRVKLTPVPGQENVYDMERADSPTEEGTPLNKSTLLQDATCLILDIPNTSVPNDAFMKLALGIGQYGYAITVVYPDGSPVEGATLTGVNAPDGGTATTDTNGLAVGVSSSQSITFGVNSPYIDVQSVSGITIQSAGILTQYTITLQYDESVKTFTSSQTVKISPKAVTADFCAVGGGGGGAAGTTRVNGGGGGGGGYAQNLTDVSLSQYDLNNIAITIGAGGNGGSSSGSSGGTGGVTSVSMGGSPILTASGGNGGTSGSSGQGGTGNGNGGAPWNFDMGVDGGNGSSGTVRIFGESSQPLAGGGGGGGGQGEYDSNATRGSYGGSPSGGSGGWSAGSSNTGDGTPGSALSGGGGGGYGNSSQNGFGTGGTGGAGGVYIRVHHLST